ncbi:cytochrome P450 [Pontibacter rugosus]|uniref:Cytochrome P450 n=1 Tax=Pontibacter rugosus TaxID=1745966 RepID=A0ABW3SSV7_9BACT
MANIPIDKSIDSTIALLQEGYLFIPNRCRKYGSDIFMTRLMFKPAICISGAEAAAVFYDVEKFKRKGATPKRVQKTLFGQKGVQTLDNAAHRKRKEMFMSQMSPENLHRLSDITAHVWKDYVIRWERQKEVVLFDEVQALLCRAVCEWSGVPLKEGEVRLRAKDFGAMVDAFGGVGWRWWRGRLARIRAEKWIGSIIENIRKGKMQTDKGTAAHVIAFHRELDGTFLDQKVAAVELINILRPTVAIATYITFCALALQQYPQYRDKLKSGAANLTEPFVQEVRRFYPFAPMVGAQVRKQFTWRNYTIKEGMLVLLDLYGTNHDPRQWQNPEEFNPERFVNWNGTPFNFIPQGGGHHLSGHRCAGEWVTIQTMKQAVEFLVSHMQYEVPAQDLSFSLSRMPTFPESKFIITNVKPV